MSRNRGVQYGRALDACNRAEARMRRAFHAWEKARAALQRCERRLDDAMRVDNPAAQP